MYFIIFDVDGMLVDSQNMIVYGVEVGFVVVGLFMLDWQIVLLIVGCFFDEVVVDFVGFDNFDKVLVIVEVYWVFKVLWCVEGFDFDFFYFGVCEVVICFYVWNDVLLGIVIGKVMCGVWYMLDIYDFNGWFVIIQIVDMFLLKLYFDMIECVIQEIGVEFGNIVMIGDIGFDMGMVKVVGVYVIGVKWGYYDYFWLVVDGVDWILDWFEELEGVIDEFFEIDREIV